MSTNTYAKPEEEKKGMLGNLSGYKFEFAFDDKTAIKYVPYFFFLTFLGVIYIANTYYADRVVREINLLEKDVEKLRVNYGSRKYEYINMSKRNEIVNQVKGLGLIENDKPVIKIEIKE
ncbi:MAG: hypothetical protein KTR26_20580 [Flammeovirgaceae bacterium]|nr:hypothetical protein [Flammeovirgaceae bacterium]